MKQTEMGFGLSQEPTESSSAPTSWPVAALEDLFEILDYLRVPVNSTERSQRQGSVPYYGATGQVGWIDAHIFNQELVLLGEDGAPFLQGDRRKAYVVKGKSWVNNHAHVLRALGQTPSRFWKYQLDQVDYRPFVSGTTRLKLSQAPMRRIPLSVPPKGEQQRIADALDSYFSRLDDAIATLERVERTLKRYRASVLKAAVEGRLVPTEAALARAEGRDFEPASALLERVLVERRRRWEAQAWEAEIAKAREKAAKAARDAAGRPWKRGDAFEAGELEGIGAAEYGRYLPKNDRWKAKYVEPVGLDVSGLPALPEGWCWATVDMLSHDARYGSSARCSPDLIEGVPVLRMGNIADGRLDFDRLKYLPADHDEFPELLLEAGDLLFNRTNSAELVGKTAVFERSHTPTSFASYLIRVRFCDGVDPQFVSASLNSPFGRGWVASVVSQQVGQANVNGTKLKNFAVPLPPAVEQERIADEIDRLHLLSASLALDTERNLKRCKRLRQSILKWAFEGKLADQDPNDEPAAALLARIKAERAAAEPTRTRRKKKDPR